MLIVGVANCTPLRINIVWWVCLFRGKGSQGSAVECNNYHVGQVSGGRGWPYAEDKKRAVGKRNEIEGMFGTSKRNTGLTTSEWNSTTRSTHRRGNFFTKKRNEVFKRISSCYSRNPQSEIQHYNNLRWQGRFMAVYAYHGKVWL